MPRSETLASHPRGDQDRATNGYHTPLAFSRLDRRATICAAAAREAPSAGMSSGEPSATKPRGRLASDSGSRPQIHLRLPFKLFFNTSA